MSYSPEYSYVRPADSSCSCQKCRGYLGLCFQIIKHLTIAFCPALSQYQGQWGGLRCPFDKRCLDWSNRLPGGRCSRILRLSSKQSRGFEVCCPCRNSATLQPFDADTLWLNSIFMLVKSHFHVSSFLCTRLITGLLHISAMQNKLKMRCFIGMVVTSPALTWRRKTAS